MKYPRLFWAMTLPIAAVSYPLVNWLAPMFAPPSLARAEIKKAFLGSWGDACVPEPLELISYALAILLPVLFMFVAVVVLKRLGQFRRTEPRSFWLTATATAAQLTLAYKAGYAWLYENDHGWKTQMFNFAFAQTVIGLCVAGYLGFCWLRADHKRMLTRACRYILRFSWPAWVIAISWGIAHLLCCVFTDDNISMASRVVGHTPFHMGEFAAVINGRVPLVNFHPQYENVLAYLLEPYFSLIGLNITKFTVTMCALSLVGFLLIYRVFSEVTGSPWRGLFLYVPWVAISLANLEPPGFPPANTFNYYAAGPIRYIGLFVMAYLSMWYLKVPRFRRLVIGSFVAGLVALNNLDFGIAAAAGFSLCAAIFPPPDRSVTRLWRTLRASAVFVGSAALAIASYWLFVRLGCGKWPDLAILTEYQRTFAGMGFNLQKLPESGLYWLLYFTFIVAVLSAIFTGFSESDQYIYFERRLSSGMLAYGAVAGFGAFSYYIARSHPSAIVEIYSAWAFVVALLAHRMLSDVREAKLNSADGGYSIFAIPTVAILALCSGLLPLVLEFPKVGDEIRRLSYNAGPNVDQRPSRLVSLISKYVKTDDTTVIVYPNAHWLAMRASVRNVFPYAHPLSLLARSQLEPTLKSIEQLPRNRQYVFGDLVSEITDWLNRAGFQLVEADGDFAVWRGPG